MKRLLSVVALVCTALAGTWYWRSKLPDTWGAELEQIATVMPGLPGLAQNFGAPSAGAIPLSGAAANETKGRHRSGDVRPAAAVKGSGGRGQHAGGPTMVKTVATTSAVLSFDIASTGWAAADKKTTIAAQAAGLIVSLAVGDGAMVKTGDLIAKIDDSMALATIEKDKALMARDDASLSQAESALSRSQNLAKSNAGSQQTLEQAKASRDTAAATLQSDAAVLASDQIGLDRTNIRAPFDGRLGELSVTTGAYVTAGTAVVTLVKYDPIYASFSVPAAYFTALSDAMSNGDVPVDASLLGQTAPPTIGALTFLDNTIDQASGTLLAKARFENAHGTLWPGQSLDLTVHLQGGRPTMVVPTVSVIPGNNSPFVYQVKDDIVHLAKVDVGRSSGDQTEILSGLTTGDRVVVEGQNQLTEGQRVAEQLDTASAESVPRDQTRKLAMGDGQ